MRHHMKTEDQEQKSSNLTFWMICLIPTIGAIVVALVAFLLPAAPGEGPRDMGPPAPKIQHEQKSDSNSTGYHYTPSQHQQA
ncbi:hypothetical protein [Priestia koreensis]|uniref:hypothetical protein n=2 Tax=Priestia koreensis TaxID=284581 RepID=UPI00203F5656|nr:hypothetical protein [Priestia koreensis]MCM3004266.1 hypothetical protein [Priestia koreensis]